ncbi:hypothetical protein [Desulfoluna sp.]|uniref:hypothetical protein n=1 Tax=Desulfoluna sp. TaxID=2045199 RepID=UPI00261BA303|nr:hypothetical protein [Desulfoluna sp.]
MQYFGYGSARIVMPRAVARHARREWIVSPSFMILVISLTFFTLYKIIFSDALNLPPTRTIILLPQAPMLPKVTVEKKLTFLTVVKEAAKKSAAPRKKELTRILESPKPLPKRVLPPTTVIKRTPPVRLPPPKKKALTLTPKPLVPPLRLQKQSLPEKRRLSPVKPQPRLPATHPAQKPAPSRSQTPAIREQRLRKVSSTPPLSMPETLNVAQPSPRPVAKSSERMRSRKRIPQPQSVTPSALVPRTKPHRDPTPSEAPSQKKFRPMALAGVSAKVLARQPELASQATRVSAIKRSGPAPVITQFSAPSAPPAAASFEKETSPPQTAKRARSFSSGALPSHLPAVPVEASALETPQDIHTWVTIHGSTLKHSLRVTSLKEEIYRKIRYMKPEKSPYRYRIQGYTCTVVIQSGTNPIATLTFQPNDATFEVVSTLERILPRRTM